jgi:hypothetical protein
MHLKLCEKQPALVNLKGSILLHDNARLHASQWTLQKLNGLSHETRPHCLTHQTCGQLITTFSSTCTTSCREKIFNNQADAECTQ